MRRVAQVAVTMIAIAISGMADTAQQWHWVPSPICARLKIRGGKLVNRRFTIYAAVSKNSECCSGLTVRMDGIVRKGDEFTVTGLQDGFYFVVFGLADGELAVPLEVKGQRPGNRCGSESTTIEADRKTGKVSVQSSIEVD